VAELDEKRAGAVRRRGGVDVFTLLVGVLALAMAVSAFVGQVVFLWPGFDPRWLLAAGAALLGVLLLSSSIRRNRRGC
jgi:fatty acid desaturase